MDNREINAGVFKDTVEFFSTDKTLLAEMTSSAAKTKLYAANEYPVLMRPQENVSDAEVRITNKRTFAAAMDMCHSFPNKKVAVLNFASAVNPGGGVINGSSAQEEDLCRRSTLAISLYQFSLPGGRYGDLADMVGVKRRAERYPMDNTYGGIYSPGITFFRATKDEGYALLDNPFQAAVISVASLNYNPKHGHNSLDANGNIPEADKPVLKEKIRTILRIGILKGHDSLVLGALGCGAFCTPPAQMARLFHQVLDEEEFVDRFRKIVFAIIDSPSSNNFKPFLKEFSK